jgi:hypothetical protein
MVARHEVPGVMKKIACPSGMIERISALTRCQHSFEQEYLGFLKRRELGFDDKYFLGLTTNSTIRPFGRPSRTKAIRSSKILVLSQR